MENNITINEDLTTPANPNIATTDQNLSVDAIFQQTNIQSLVKQISAIATLSGPSGGIFNIIKENGNFKVIRRDVEVFPSELKNTKVTREVIQDIKAQFGKDADIIIGTLFRGISNEMENDKLLDVLTTYCKDYGDLQLSDSLNAELNLFEITQRVHEIILQMNSKYQRTYEAFAIVPYKALGGIMGLSQYAGAVKKEERGLFITQIGSTRFYLNPFVNDTNVYVGLNDKDEFGKSSLVFSPYQNSILETIDSETGEEVYFLCNRFAITPSPLHRTDEEMLYKFKVLV